METLPNTYLVLRQIRGNPCEIVLIEPNKETILFSGKRWPMRHTFNSIRQTLEYKNIPAYCLKRPPTGSKRGSKGALVLVEDFDTV
jgi:hypothetical protein